MTNCALFPCRMEFRVGNLIKGNIALGGNGSGDYLGKRVPLVTILILEAQVCPWKRFFTATVSYLLLI